MTPYQNVFNRYEQKYLLNREKYQTLLEYLSAYLTQDQYGRHTIGNIYYDTPDFALIRNSIEKPVYKEKLRLRSYGVPGTDDFVFLELKKKFARIVNKRRIQLTLKEAQRYVLQGEKPSSDTQILQEIDWFLKMHRLVPQVFIAYERAAYFGKEDENLRVTFDQEMRFRASCLDLSLGDWGRPLLDTDSILLEIKIPGAIPLWLNRLLTEMELFPTPFSKYGVCYKTHLFSQLHPKGGVRCA
ncbi:MAG: polyphosphate polymerase domain-containing protein [Clostridia bacterium]|jgi:hypothetical protein|nr:polyphosphate polymerase domain-containing protein [Clostridia bacterium]